MNKRLVAGVLILSILSFFSLGGCTALLKDTDPSTTQLTSSETTASSTSEETASVTTTESVTETTTETTIETTETTTEITTETTETTEESTTETTETTEEPTETTEETTETTEETTTQEIISEPPSEQTEETVEPSEPVSGPSTIPVDPDADYLSRIGTIRRNIESNAAYYDSLDNYAPESWCFQRKKDHSPSGTYEFFKIADYHSAYRNTHVAEGDKVIYLTFDCGYPSDNTVTILDILAKHNVKASFFVTKMYLEKCSGYASRMKEEGHMVCNHTVTHTDLLPKTVEDIAAEIFDTAEYFYEKTGYTLDPYFRTPKGTYSKRLLSIIKDAGYMTVFWSIAYDDYSAKQPDPGYVTDHFATYHHNGAVALMHNDSSANVNELDAVLTLLENEGYRFGLLNELE